VESWLACHMMHIVVQYFVSDVHKVMTCTVLLMLVSVLLELTERLLSKCCLQRVFCNIVDVYLFHTGA
jgi:hypothetical protein